MMVNTSGSTLRLIAWQWKYTAMFTVGGVAAALLHQLGQAWAVLPTVPLAVVGGAIGIFVSFRTNSCYDRWWEGRKLWGRLINTSRHWCTQAVGYIGESVAPQERAAERLVRRQVVYVHTLRVLLRQQRLGDDPELVRLLSNEALDRLAGESNPTHALLQDQMDDLRELRLAGVITEFNQSDMDESIRHLLDIQGGCERIKKTPFPRGYGFIAERLVIAYGFLFPFAIVADLGWIAVPMNLLVCLAFALISETGRVLEDPFTMFFNGLPLSAMSTTIERNLRQRIGDTDLPAAPQPDPRGILM